MSIMVMMEVSGIQSYNAMAGVVADCEPPRMSGRVMVRIEEPAKSLRYREKGAAAFTRRGDLQMRTLLEMRTLP